MSKLNIGFESLQQTTNDKLSNEEYAAMMEDLAMLDQQYLEEEMLDNKRYIAYALVTEATKLPEDQKKVVFDFLSQDETMKTIIEASEEGQKLQDFLRWGLDGMLVGLYLGSFGRITRILSNPVLNPNGNSQYLLPERYVNDCLTACESMFKAIKAGKSKDILEVFRKCGFTIDHATDTDWAAVGGTIIAQNIGNAIVPGVGYLVGKILGKYVSSKVRKSASEHGYTQQNFEKHCKRICEIIKQISAMKDATTQLDDPGAKSVAKKAMKMVCQGISTIGRGFCAVTQ